MERWQRGRMHRSWKPERGKPCRGFESHPLRSDIYLSEWPELFGNKSFGEDFKYKKFEPCKVRIFCLQWYNDVDEAYARSKKSF